MFNTEIVPINENEKSRYAVRCMSDEEFIDKKASGTLRKNSKLGFRYKDQLNAERIAYEFGYSFESLTSTRITFNDAMTTCDDSAITYSGWVAERYISLRKIIFPEDEYVVKYIIVERENGKREEGIALIIKRTSFPFVRKDHIVFSFLALYTKIKSKKKKNKKKYGYIKVANFS
jgi:hypothetical protein